MRLNLDHIAFEFDGEHITWFEIVFWSVSGVVCISPFIVLFVVLLLLA